MEPPARAADRARIQVPFLYRGCGPAWWPVPCRRLMRGRAGMAVNAGCGTQVLRRAVAVGPVVRDDAAGRLAVAGHGFVSVSVAGYPVREVAR